jgi:hypothetical protein
MKTFSALGLAVISGPALAHTALVDHGHPHGSSALFGVDAYAALFALAATGIAVLVSMRVRARAGEKARK